MTYGRLWKCVLGAALLWSVSVDATAQEAARLASLTAQVVDETGAVVPQASVSVRRLSTGVERRVDLSAEGVVSIPDLQPGDYEVTATSAGFALAVQRVSLRAGETRLRF